MALFLAGLGLGLFLAAQVGPVTLLIVCSVLRGGRALLVGLAMAQRLVLITDHAAGGEALQAASQLGSARSPRLRARPASCG
jgi:hypothetical protein